MASCSITRNIELAKSENAQNIKPQSLIYALPQTGVAVTLQITKTTIKKGVYAEYASRFLNLANVPQTDSETYSISQVSIDSKIEADPSQYYAITYKTYPENLNKLLAVTNQGVVLDFASAWKKLSTETLPPLKKSEPVLDPYLLEETVREKVDTFYKTIMTDSSIVKIPVYKKQSQPKTIEEFAREAANELIKTRKRRLKILRGEYEFHPDGEALKVMSALLSRQEDHYMALFIGTKQVDTSTFHFSFTPQQDLLSKELGYFSVDKGFSVSGSGLPLTVQLAKAPGVIKSVVPLKVKNQLYIRVPVQTLVTVSLKNEIISSGLLPVYQFGHIQAIPLQ